MENSFHKIILGAICWAVISFFLIIPLSLLFIIKCIVIIIAAIVRRDLYSIAAGDAPYCVDSSWKKSKNNVGFVLIIEGTLELISAQKQIRSILLEPKIGKKLKYERLHSCLVTWCGFVFRRLIPIDLDKLGELIYVKTLGSEETLEELLDKWMVRSYRENAPAWEMIIIPKIPNYSLQKREKWNCTGKSAVAFKIHHALVDGYSILHILDAITGCKSPLTRYGDLHPVYEVKDPQESFYKKIVDLLTLPVNLPTIFGDRFPTTDLLKVSRPQSLWMYSFTSIDLHILKSLRKMHNVHFVSILLTLIAGSIRQYLLEKEKEDYLPSYILLVNTLPWPNHPRTSLTNHWTAGVVKIPFKLDDPLKRLLEVERNFLDFNNKGLPKFVKQVILPLTWLSPQFLLQKAVQIDAGCNTGLTSLVGADNYTFLRKPVSHVHPLVNFSDTSPYRSFSWFTFTHSNKIDISLTGAPDLFCPKCLDRILGVYFKTELQKLCNQSGV